ncbi:hypothetical protein [Actinokineospora globicatena]|uniref:Uncharacterized protein n=1 Tax=Actinokineospora globicatena TaxID=103729 RepID=A0A9W6QM18_9PSEU|nr:hypothetical protein [Actinokineospora globicatena]MCP2304461.1 hypothetical protein [Actinokineospora globicatena]GLW78173.1 hypothetical protein Aglo01_26550 [Actinokineospora globicatena]GLW85161.1 hypothetical protein Aglo02_28010 [Actinokineospora globicatena]GLW90778.1 hypothetical protein Aglo03_15940 [Actinokineospora globicatena]
MTCPDCATALDHCHGTLIPTHSTCTTPSCVDLDPARHPLTATDDDLLPHPTSLPAAA